MTGRREQIEQALVELSVERRFKNLLLADVLEAAGVDETEFNRHFEDLEDCFAQVFAAGTQEVIEETLPAFAAEETWRDGIRAVAATFYRLIAEDPVRGAFLFREVFSAGEQTQLVRDQGMQAMYFIIDQGRYERDDPESVTPATAEAIAGTILMQIHQAVETDQLEKWRLKIPGLMYTVVRPYLGEAAAREELEMPPPMRAEPPRERVAQTS